MSKQWQIRKLGEVACVSAGNSAPQDARLFAGGTHRFIRTSDVGEIRVGEISDSADKLNDEGVKGLRIFRAGTTLLPKSGASTFNNHRTLLTVPSAVSSHLAVVDADNAQLDDRFVFYFLQTVRAQDLIGDQSYPSLNLRHIESIPIPTPPLTEQRRLVDKLESLTLGISKLNELGAQRTELGAEIGAALVDELMCPKSGWVNRSLSEWCVDIGTGPFGSLVHKSDYQEQGVPLVNPMNIKDGRIVESGIKRVTSSKAQELNRYVLRTGDVVLGRRGEMGRCAVVHPEHDGWLCGTGSFFLRPSEDCNSHLLALWLSSRNGRNMLSEISSGATMDNLGNKELGLLRLALPTRSSQDDLVKRATVIQELTSATKVLQIRRSHLLVDLNQSFLTSAFRGEL